MMQLNSCVEVRRRDCTSSSYIQSWIIPVNTQIMPGPLPKVTGVSRRSLLILLIQFIAEHQTRKWPQVTLLNNTPCVSESWTPQINRRTCWGDWLLHKRKDASHTTSTAMLCCRCSMHTPIGTCNNHSYSQRYPKSRRPKHTMWVWINNDLVLQTSHSPLSRSKVGLMFEVSATRTECRSRVIMV